MASGPLSARVRQMRYMVGLLRYDEPQTLSSAQRTQARGNIGAADAATAALAARKVNAKTGLKGGGDLTQDLDVEADIATQTEAQVGTASDKLMTPLRTAQAIAAQTLGIGQRWRNVLPSRAVGTAYQNTTGKPIMVLLGVVHASRIEFSADGSVWEQSGDFDTDNSDHDTTPSFVVPPGHFYRAYAQSAHMWMELR